MPLSLTRAIIVRFANAFLDKFKAKDFVLVAMFIWQDGNATRYTMLQQNERAVCCGFVLYIKLAS
jgi:hypothetical protein